MTLHTETHKPTGPAPKSSIRWDNALRGRIKRMARLESRTPSNMATAMIESDLMRLEKKHGVYGKKLTEQDMGAWNERD